MAPSHIGRSVPRKEGRAKVEGTARYLDDITMPGMLHGATIRSEIPRGRITDIRFEGPIPWDEFTIVTAKDIPGKNYVAQIEHDQPFLAEKRVNHPEEPIVLIAHPDKDLVHAARRHVRITIEPMQPVLTLEDSLRQREIVWGRDNVFKSYVVEKGDVTSAPLRPVVTVEGEYETGAQEQLYIEPNGMIAVASPETGVTVWGSMQCPYYVHKALVPLFELPPDRIRIIQTETGGAFGGKEEYPSLIAGHAALLAWKSGKPVKIVYDRAEDMAATTKRHPSRTRIRTRVEPTGKLVSQEIEFVIDGGAYVTLSPVVLSRGTIHAAGPYRCDNVRITSRAVATNTPPNGAFRGFGAPQSIFAMERHMDRVANALGIAPDELRRRNFLEEGERTATDQEIREKIDFPALLDRAMKLSDFRKKRRAFESHNRKSPVKKGIGLATFMHGAGFTGSGETFLASVVGVEATAEGKIRVLSASTEMGQGTNTIFSQVVADTLGLEIDDVVVAQPDTKDVPNSGPTVASRTCMVVGSLLESAARSLRETLVASGLLPSRHRRKDFLEACRRHVEERGPLKAYAQYKAPEGVFWDDAKYRGDAYATYAWAVYVAEVSVDTRTFETRVDDFVAVQEVGRVVHPLLAAGQIEGGVAQGVGFALYEKVVYDAGRMTNHQMTNYIMPTSVDVPRIRVHFEEINRRFGPQGAKGIGELPIDGPAPAILNAVEHATGVSVARIPMLPEDLMRAVQGAREASRA